MTAYPAWTPAARPGIVPLHPYGFGTILGRSFTALRHNPKVLLGFALVVQTVAYLVLTVVIGGVAVASFTRLDTVPAGSDDYDAVMAGSLLLTGGTALVLGLAAGVLSVVVQGVVVVEVAHAVVDEKPTLGQIWTRVKPAFWRMVGYSALVVSAVVAVVGVLVLVIVLIALIAPPAAIVLGVLLAIGAVPLYLWLSTKLFLVPASIILERASVRGGIVRSWTLTRGRFWSTLGVIVVISLAFSMIAQFISIPFSLIGSAIASIVSPTGDEMVSTMVSLIIVQVIGQGGVLLVQSIALVVQATSAALVYVDARMRVEGLDQDLLGYVEARDAGAADLPDPFTVGVGRRFERPAWGVPAAAWGAPAAGAPVWGPPPPAWQGSIPAGGAAPAWGPPAPAPGGAAPAWGPPAPGVSAPAAWVPPTAPPPPPAAAPTATSWAPPGESERA